jgi:TonB-linked SusC/RagA family outer membrane protein
MKCAFITILICIATLSGLSQNVTISEKDITLAKMLSLIQKQTGCYFSFSTGITGDVTKVSLNVKDKPLSDALNILFSKLPYTYLLKDKFILVIDRKNNKRNLPTSIALSGTVETENGEPIAGATISLLNTQRGFITNSNGQFSIADIQKNTSLKISSIGYEPKQIVITDQVEIKISLKPITKELDEIIAIGYGKTTRRLNTGNVFKVRGQEIADQPVSNFVATLPGRVPGMLISQKNGIPGTSYKIELRGKSSISSKSGIAPILNINTLILVDGIPFAPNNNNLPVISAGAAIGEQGRNAFDLININDIESIEVLKDADATAIYGSRGANGVILVTTKKGAAGKRALSIDVQTGLGQITRYPNMMNTQQYLAMRRSAIFNDGNNPNNTNAPDLCKWDTTRYTNLKKILIGGTSRLYNTHISLSGGSNSTQYLISGSWRKETTVYPGDFSDNTFYSHAALHHHSKNNKLRAGLSIMVSHDNNYSLVRDLTALVTLPPNVPAFYDSVGNLKWQENGYSFNNPFATLRQPYHVSTDNILTDLNVSYYLLKNLYISLNGGINNIKIDELILQPRSSQNTFSIPNATGQAFFANSKLKSFTVEPQLDYRTTIGKGKFSIVLGSTYQQLTTRIINESAYGYPNDSSLTDISKAKTHIVTPSNSIYKYVGVFGRLSYDWMNKYIINITGRRDGSSRFGPGHQFGNFGAIGAAWIFSKENLIVKHIPFISFGKLRASYGVTGSDQIGDYRYLDQWAQTSGTYQGDTGLAPLWPANPYYSWEETHKLEGAIDFGMFNNHLLLSMTYYQNRTGNQIITKSIPAITGFDQLPSANYPAIVENKGWELSLQYNYQVQKNFSTNTNLVITIPKNKLLSFPNLSNSIYAGNNNFQVGKSISSISGLSYTGIDGNTGLFRFKDNDNNGTLSSPNDYSILANQDPIFYGSLINTLIFKNWELTSLVEFKKQSSYNFLYQIYLNKPPGLSKSNQPELMSDYWQKQGDQSYIQKLTASTSSTAYEAINNFTSSSGVISDASYIRIKMLSLSYTLPNKTLLKIKLSKCRFYMAANNLVIFTHFKATDPETVDTFTLPPIRTIAVGIHIAF